MNGKLVLWIICAVLICAGGVFLFSQYAAGAFGQGIALSLPAVTGSAVPNTQDLSGEVQESVRGIDRSLASQIRHWREEGWQAPAILSAVTESVEQASETTVSATVSTTPGEVWQSFRDQGAQAALGEVLGTTEVSVNAVTQNAVNEARYQYCLGVVDAYERR